MLYLATTEGNRRFVWMYTSSYSAAYSEYRNTLTEKLYESLFLALCQYNKGI